MEALEDVKGDLAIEHESVLLRITRYKMNAALAAAKAAIGETP